MGDRSFASTVFVAAALILFSAPSVSAAPVQLSADLDHSVMRADAPQTGYMRVALTGGANGQQRRAPMNVAIVLDKSSSMSGEKIRSAKEAARAALEQLRSEDIVSVVAYDSTVQVLVPATKVADRREVLRGIDRLSAGGMTALFAGTSKGAAEVRKFLDRRRVNRVILLSDGQANVGPSSPGELGRLGEALIREGVAVTTVGLGLGYNEDLMVALADRSGGQHTFVEHASELAGFFRRGFASLAAIVAQELVVEVTFAEGFRPVRALGVDAEVSGQTLITRLSQLYASQTDELLLAFEASPHATGSHRIADVRVTWHDVGAQGTDEVARSVSARFSSNPREVEASAISDVMIAVVASLSNERSRQALQLRDQGRTQEAEQTLRDNMAYLKDNAKRYGSDVLDDLGDRNRQDLNNMDDGRWKKQRKEMKKRQKQLKTRVYDFEAAEDLF